MRLNSSSASPEAVSTKSLHHRTPAAFGIVDIVATHLDPSYARIPWAEPALKSKLQNLHQPNQSCQLASNDNEGTDRTDLLGKKWFQDSSTTATKEVTESRPQKSRKSKGKAWLCRTFEILQTCFPSDGRSPCRIKYTRSVEVKLHKLMCNDVRVYVCMYVCMYVSMYNT